MSPADEALIEKFVDQLILRARYNIAPGAQVPVIAMRDREPALEVLRWGLKSSGKPFNIRDDSAGKPWARTLLKSRVVFPLSGFYEWQAQPEGPKRPHFFRPAADDWLAIAGVLGHWDGPGVSGRSRGHVSIAATGRSFSKKILAALAIGLFPRVTPM